MVFSWLVAAFVIVPLVELALLFKVSESLGVMSTIAIVVVTGVVGAGLARVQGLRVMRHIQADVAQGRMPAPRLMDGLMILVAGVLLITPGLLTDTTGFLLLVPAVRTALRGWLRKKFEERMRAGAARTTVWRW